MEIEFTIGCCGCCYGKHTVLVNVTPVSRRAFRMEVSELDVDGRLELTPRVVSDTSDDPSYLVETEGWSRAVILHLRRR